MTGISTAEETISEDDLPEAQDLEFTPLADKYAKSLIVTQCFVWAFVAMMTFLLMFFTGGKIELFFSKYLLLGAYIIPVIAAFILAPMVARSRGYAICDGDIHYRSGIIWQKTVSLPYNRIQHVEVESGPLERYFKLTSLKFFTAGGGTADMTIPALTFAVSHKLRAFVLEKAGVSEADDEAHFDD